MNPEHFYLIFFKNGLYGKGIIPKDKTCTHKIDLQKAQAPCPSFYWHYALINELRDERPFQSTVVTMKPMPLSEVAAF